MTCKTASSLSGVATAPQLPSTLPTTPGAWASVRNAWAQLLRLVLSASSHVNPNLIPPNYATFNGSALPPFTATGCTVAQDAVNTYGGTSTLKVTVTGANATLVFGSTNLSLTPFCAWLASFFAKCSEGAGAALVLTTANGTYTTDFGATTAWEQFYDTLNMQADDSAVFGLSLSFPSCVGAVFNFTGFALQATAAGQNASIPFGTIGATPGVDLGSAIFSGTVPYANNSPQVTQVVGNNKGDGQLNVSPSGGVTNNLPLGNHATSVQLGAVSGAQVNLIPDSGLKTPQIYWPNAPAAIKITKNMDGVNNCFEYTGNGSPSGYNYQVSVPFSVLPGNYTLSATGWTNNVTAGNIAIYIQSPDLSVTYGSLPLTSNARQAATITIPSGVTSVVAAFDTNNATVANGAGCGAENPQLEVGDVMTAYKENVGDRNAGTLGIDFDNNIHANKNLDYLSDGPSGNRLAWLGAQQTSLIQNQTGNAGNHLLDPGFTNPAAFWGTATGFSGLSFSQGAVAANTYSTPVYNQDGHGNVVYNRVDPGDNIVLQVSLPTAATGTAASYLAAEYCNGSYASLGLYLITSGPPTGVNTGAGTVPSGTVYVRFFMQSSGGASGGNAAMLTAPQVRINNETSSDPNGDKAYANLNDNTPGGHTGPSYALGDTVTGAIQASATPVLDGGIVTFQVPFDTQPEVLWLDGGCGFSGSQYQQFTETFTQNSGQYTGFTASLKIVTPAGSLTNESVNFSAGSATVTIPGGNSVVNGSFTASGSVENPDGESNVITVTLDDATNGISASKNYTVAAKSTKAFSITMTDAKITNGQTMTLSFSSGGSASGTPTLTYQVQTTPTIASATPPGFPGVNWIAFATS